MSVLSLLQRTLPPSCQKPLALVDVPAIILSDLSCFRSTLSLLVGVGIVALAGLIKLPQIAAIVEANSAEGLSIVTLLVETFGYVYNLAAHYRMKYPVSTYGDFAVLTAQNLVILLLTFRYSNRFSQGLMTVVSYIAILICMCSSLFPIGVLQTLTLCNVLVSFASRVPQISQNFQSKSTGNLSAITCFGVFLGATARVFTTLQDVDSLNILLGYITSAFLNGVIAFQILLYGKRSEKKAE